VFTGDLPSSERAARSLPPFPMWPALPASEYYGGSATPRRNSGRCACPDPNGSAGTTGALPTFTNHRSAGSASSFTPVASPRSTATRRAATRAHGRARRPPHYKENRGPRQPIPASFGAVRWYRGFIHWFGFPTPFCLAWVPGPLAATRHYVVGAALARAAHLSSRTAPSFSRPSRRPRAGPFIPPGWLAPRGARSTQPVCLTQRPVGVCERSWAFHLSQRTWSTA
jgi:hypothetical protein